MGLDSWPSAMWLWNGIQNNVPTITLAWFPGGIAAIHSVSATRVLNRSAVLIQFFVRALNPPFSYYTITQDSVLFHRFNLISASLQKLHKNRLHTSLSIQMAKHNYSNHFRLSMQLKWTILWYDIFKIMEKEMNQIPNRLYYVPLDNFPIESSCNVHTTFLVTRRL